MTEYQIETLVIIAVIVATAALNALAAVRAFQAYQLSGYKRRAYFRWLISSGCLMRYVFLALLQLVCLFAVIFLFGWLPFAGYAGMIFPIGFNILYYIFSRRAMKKTPLKFTARAVRLIVTACVLISGLSFIAAWFTRGTPVMYLPVAALPALLPFIVYAAGFINLPAEKIIARKFIASAQEKLFAVDGLKVIGITGSYGKTGVKQILTQMLKQEFYAVCPPQSYNTPLGIARFINSPEFKPEPGFFVAEMGARQSGDIKELCEMLRPVAGIITSVGTQHLETFKTPENVAAAKYELAEYVGGVGFTAFSGTDAGSKALFDKTPGEKILASGGTSEGAVDDGRAAYACFTEPETKTEGSAFTLEIDGKRARVSTVLLGEHNISNITLAAAAAYKLGVPFEKIVKAVGELEPVPHRLQLIKSAPGRIIIDDAYNANERGAEAALKTLARFPGVKVIITPGLVELGERTNEANKRLGALSAKYADRLIAVGLNAPAVKSGALGAGMPPESVFVTRGLNEAVKLLENISGEMTVLFENDLPDTYTI